jgi:hypothetical protein
MPVPGVRRHIPFQSGYFDSSKAKAAAADVTSITSAVKPIQPR